MFLKILKKDFKRKKAMNAILFIFLLTAGILIASSANLLYSTVTAVDYFMDKSKVTDVVAMTNQDQKTEDRIRNWAENSKAIKDYQSEALIAVDESKVNASTGNKLKNTGLLVVMAKPDKYNLVFDGKGKDFEVGDGEAAVPVSVQRKMGLSEGSRIVIDINGYRKEFTVSCVFKDAVFGSEPMKMKRIIVSQRVFNTFFQKSKKVQHYQLWGFQKNSGYTDENVEKEISDLSILTQTIMSKGVISTAYVMDMVLAGVMILVSIFLILISFLILRFTIVFTIMQDYQQIGVMKAIGLKSSKVRGMYSVKYFTLSVISGAIGFLLSFPVSGLMKQNMNDYILIKESMINKLIAFASVCAVVGITMLFCNSCTGKIKKISAIDAIRQGSSGERFQNTKKLKLSRRKVMKVPLFLAVSDIISDSKKFIILVITYILGTAIIIIPNNVLSTLNSDHTITLFGFCDSDFYVRDEFMGNQLETKKHIDELKEQFYKAGVKAELRADLHTNATLYTDDQSDRISILGFQGVGIDEGEYDYLEGTAPALEDEIAVTEKTAKYLGVNIGDRVICDIQGVKKEYIITALFQTLNTLGNAVRLPEGFTAKEGSSTSVSVSGKLSGTAKEKKDQLERLKKEFPKLNIKTGKEVTESFIGNINEQVNVLKNLIFILVSGINFLITSLLLRMLISKEMPEIAILKSQGFYRTSIRKWQIYRISIILAISMIIGIILANTAGNILTSGVFAEVGLTRMHLRIEPGEVFILYPFLLFIVTMLAAVLSLGSIDKTNVEELNNQE